MKKNQTPPHLKLKIALLQKGINQKDLLPLLNQKYPKLKITEPHISMALRGKYEPMRKRIEEVIKEL